MDTMRRDEGWLLDLYPRGGEMVLWFILAGGERVRLVDPFQPSFYIDEAGLGRTERRGMLAAVGRLAGLETAGTTERTDFWTGRPRAVMEVRITDMERYGANLRRLYRGHPGATYYNCDIVPEVHYCYETGLFPTARCRVEWDGGRLTGCRPLERQRETGYPRPPLAEAELWVAGVRVGPRPGVESIALSFEGRTWSWEAEDPAEMLRSFRDQLARLDPDVIWTTGGDALQMPALFGLAAACGVNPGLDREGGIERRGGARGRTYVSYGQVLYHAPDYPLFGRWHIDRNNSFWSREAGLEGLIEVARMGKLPVQRAARRSVGTGISSIQLDQAYREGVLIPWKKSQPEGWKSAALLLKSDRGGLVYQPIVGVYEDVIELDFVSMYPTIMVRRNVSPETVNCACCEGGGDVPELGYRICRRREGLVSRALEPIISKRREYKAMMREEADEARRAALDGRQGALKWLLVCCFGYLGYRNARFGRIEAHESTCAFSRELLMRAKEESEARGFEVIHGIVDCLWLRREGADDDAIGELCAAIERETDLLLGIEGRYRWIVFLPSRQNEEMPVPNRYFGCFDNGKLKYRGIEARRSDQAPIVKAFQLALLEKLAGAESVAGCRAMAGELRAMVEAEETRVRGGEAGIEELLLRRKTSKAAEDYRGNSMTAVAARQARRAGLDLNAGQSIYFLVTRAGDRDPDTRVKLSCLLQPEETYDAEYYVEQLHRAAATVLEPLMGMPLWRFLGREDPSVAKKRRRKNEAAPCNTKQPDLFEMMEAG